MLEQDWRDLVAQGKASDTTPTSSFTLADFEREIAHIRRYGTSIASSSTGASLIAGEVHERLKSRLEQELAVLASCGWSVEALRGISEKDTVLASRKLNAARPHIEEHAVLIRRLTCLPWKRDIALALDIEASLRDPLKIAMLSEGVAGYARHLADRPIEDEGFEMTPWSPKPPRKTLLPLPEQGLRPTLVPTDALGDAHEAMLHAMEGGSAESQPARIETKIPAPAIIRPNEVAKELVADVAAPKVEPSAPTQVQRKAPEPEVVEVRHPAPEKRLPSLDIVNGVSSFLKMIDCDQMAVNLDENGPSAFPEIRRSLAQHVGLEPRDSRVDRLLRLSLRLMPKGDDEDHVRMEMLHDIGSNTSKIKRWMRTRLEHRHSGSMDDFLVDAANLGEALHRIPGPGSRVPLTADTKELPNASDLAGLRQEVGLLIASMNPASAGGISS
jgi:hypothetical protein